MASSNRKLTLGFKLMSGFHLNAVDKDTVASLGSSNKVSWGRLRFEETVNAMGTQLLKSKVFLYWNSWGFSMTGLLSDYVALNFVLVTLKDWQRKREPTAANSGDFKQFIKNAQTSLDQSMYEYVTRQWGGAGDSKIARNLEALGHAPDVFPQVPKEKWERLIAEVVDEGKIEGQIYLTQDPDKTYPRALKALLAYYYVIAGTPAPASVEQPIEVDHIIPRAVFKAVARPEIKLYCNHITNLAFLPKTPNNAKSEKRLIDVPDQGLREQISRYADIPLADFGKYSDPLNFDDLRTLRGGLLKTVLTERRQTMLGA